jgi:hypothetical protein
MLTTVEGVYENGRVELAERPAGVERAKVYVTFVKEAEERVWAPGQSGADAIDRWLASMREGFALGGPRYPSRDDLHDRGR